MAIVTINDYTTYPTHNARPFSRQCPNLRTCWPGLSATFNPVHASRAVTLRRIAFIATLSLRFLHNLITTWYSSGLGWGLPSTVIGILFFFFMAWNLHLIVNMDGNRMVMGRTYGRRDFDTYLGAFVGLHLLLVIADMGMRGVLGGVPGYFMWGCVDLAIFGTAWVATWDEDEGGMTLP